MRTTSGSSEPGPWVAEGYLSLNQGMLLLAMENARSGLIWRLFHDHRFVREGMTRLGLPPPTRHPSEEDLVITP